MTNHDFKLLSKQNQIHLTVFDATYLCSREVNGCSVCLYYYEGLFIEVYHINSEHVDVMLNSFTGSVPLDYYLDSIDLEFLMD